MASSGLTVYSATELDIYTDVLQSLGVVGIGVDPPAEYVVVLRRKLNFLLKQWVGQADFAPGLKMWTRRRGFLFFVPDQHVYTIGTGGDKCADENYVSTTTTVAAALGAASITVDDASDISASDNIGILLDSGTIQWTTVSGAPSGSVVTLAAVLTGAAASGARVFAYTTAARNPFEIESASVRNASGEDTYVYPRLGLTEYEMITAKTAEGTPSGLYFEAGKEAGTVYLNREPDDMECILRFVYSSYIEDAGTLSTSIDIPAEWTRAVAAQLAIDAAPAFRATVTDSLKLTRDESLTMARNAHPATSSACYESEPDDY